MKTNFYLKRPDYSSTGCEKPTAIYLNLNYQGKRLKIPVGESVPSKVWNKDRQMINYHYKGSVEINQRLRDLSEQVIQTVRQMRAEGAVINAKTVQQRMQPVVVAFHIAFWQVWDEYINNAKTICSKGTLQVYRSTKKHLEKFQEQKCYKIEFETITPRFYNLWLDYFYDQGFVDNTVGKYVKTLKSFLHFATDRGYNDYSAFQRFKAPDHEVDTVYLTFNDLLEIKNLRLVDHPDLSEARDWFLLSCFTGLPYIDMMQLKPEHCKFNRHIGDYLHLISRKTRHTLRIPIVNPYVKQIIDRIIAGHLHRISNPKMNVYVKELAKMAGISELCEVTHFRGSERITRVIPKHELVSTHTGRRTFVTQSLERGMRPEVVMQITGHKDEKSFNKYVKITDRHKIEEMKKAWS